MNSLLINEIEGLQNQVNDLKIGQDKVESMRKQFKSKTIKLKGTIKDL